MLLSRGRGIPRLTTADPSPEWRGLPGFLLAQLLTADRLGDAFLDSLLVQVGVPRVEGPHPGRLAQLLPVLADPGQHDVAPVVRGEPQVAAGDLEAGRQPLDIPLPRTGQRLVEVVDV